MRQVFKDIRDVFSEEFGIFFVSTTTSIFRIEKCVVMGETTFFTDLVTEGTIDSFIGRDEDFTSLRNRT
jgi:hypothetical protein